MTRRSDYLRAVALGLLTVATTWASLTSWRGFVEYPSAYLLESAALGVTLAVVGGVLGVRFGIRSAVVVEALIALLALSWVGSGRFVPFTGRSVLGALHDAISTANANRAPFGAWLPSVTPLLLLGSAFALVLALVLAVHVRRPPLAGLVLLAVFALHAGWIGLSDSVDSFVAAAIGFLLMLLVDARAEQRRWGLGRPAGDRAASVLTGLRSAAPIGAVAIGVAHPIRCTRANGDAAMNAMRIRRISTR